MLEDQNKQIIIRELKKKSATVTEQSLSPIGGQQKPPPNVGQPQPPQSPNHGQPQPPRMGTTKTTTYCGETQQANMEKHNKLIRRNTITYCRRNTTAGNRKHNKICGKNTTS